MKTLLLGLTLLASVSSFANDIDLLKEHVSKSLKAEIVLNLYGDDINSGMISTLESLKVASENSSYLFAQKNYDTIYLSNLTMAEQYQVASHIYPIRVTYGNASHDLHLPPNISEGQIRDIINNDLSKRQNQVFVDSMRAFSDSYEGVTIQCLTSRRECSKVLNKLLIANSDEIENLIYNWQDFTDNYRQICSNHSEATNLFIQLEDPGSSFATGEVNVAGKNYDVFGKDHVDTSCIRNGVIRIKSSDDIKSAFSQLNQMKKQLDPFLFYKSKLRKLINH